jgi:hypothetical protein
MFLHIGRLSKGGLFFSKSSIADSITVWHETS